MSTPRRLLVSGGASGIGRAVTALAAASGASVVAFDRDLDGLTETARQTGAATVECDVTDEASVAAAVARACDLLDGPPDAVVCAAGIYRVEPALDITAQRFMDVLTVNTVGSFLMAREGARAISAGGRPGAIVLLSSMATEHGDLGEPAAHYAASKGAVVALTRQLAVEWAEHSIRVNAVSPGVIRTPMLRLMDDPEAAADYLSTHVPLHRLGEADEVARACLWLAGNGSSYVTGTVLPVDGGATVT